MNNDTFFGLLVFMVVAIVAFTVLGVKAGSTEQYRKNCDQHPQWMYDQKLVPQKCYEERNN